MVDKDREREKERDRERERQREREKMSTREEWKNILVNISTVHFLSVIPSVCEA